jgi:tetratricopeptide (TPR) repeat protein
MRVTPAAAESQASALAKLEELLNKTAVAYDTMVARRAPPPVLKLIRANLVQLHLRLGEHYLAAGQWQSAVESARQVEVFSPDDSDAAMLAARAQLSANQTAQALDVLERAAAAHRNDGPIQALLAQVYVNSGRPADAIEPFRRALGTQPDNAVLMAGLANALALAGRAGEALITYRGVLALKPEDIDLLSRYAYLANDAGAFDEAHVALVQLMQLQPGKGLNHRLFGKLHRYAAEDPHIARMQSLLPAAVGDDARELHFALFNAYESLGDFDRAFAHLKAANDIRKSQVNYRADVFAALFANVQSTFTAVDRSRIAASPRTESPIFVVGMPRSGSTLVEQILDSHPDASAAGETPAFAALVEKHFLARDLTYDLRLLGDIRGLAALGEAYFAAIGEHADLGRRTVDKYLTNFMSLGIIKAVFPKARIVHCRRNPLANCFSAYASHFDTTGLAFKSDMEETARYYVRYHRLMQFWKGMFGDDILDLSYEKLTLDQEAETRRLLDYCGLDWDPACLDFHKNERVVKTASYMQVRQPIYSGIDRRTGNYLAHLGPMVEVLKQAGLI